MVTVLLPTYNAEKYIAQCIKSILHQTYRDFELLIIDSASDDNTVKIVKSFEDPRINLHQIERCPLGRSLNYGLKNAKFDLIARMDADDLMVPERLEVQLAYLKEHPEVDVLSCNSAYFFNSRILYLLKLPLKDKEIKELMLLHNPMCHPGIIFKRDFIRQHGGFSTDYQICQDYELWMRLKNFAKFSNVERILVFLRFNKLSLSRKSREITKSEVYKLHNDYFSHKNVEELSNSIKINLQGWRELFYGDRIQARKHFVTNLNSVKVCIAFLLTFLSQSKIDLLLERNLFARLKYVIHYFDPEMVGIRHTLKQLLK